MPDYKTRKLELDEIKKLNKDGYKLDESGKELYLVGFLVNSEPNTAGDPRPFKIRKDFEPKLAKTAVGRAWLPLPMKNGLHVRPSPDATAEEIVQFQKDYAGGEIITSFFNEETQNHNFIVRVFPEYHDLVIEKKYEPLLSPMIGNWKEDENGEIYEGEILHVQSVRTSGYDPSYAKFTGACVGGVEQCMKELIPLAAAGKLNQYRNSGQCSKKFFSIPQALGASAMSAIPPDENQVKLSDVAVKVEEHTKVLSEHTEKLNTIGTDVASIKTTLEGKQTPPPGQPPVAAAGETKTVAIDEIKTIKDELAAIKKEREDEKNSTSKKIEQLAQKERARQAEIIVKLDLINRKYTPEKKQEMVKHYLELKDPQDPEKPRDLSLLAETAEKAILEMMPEEEKPLAAFGLYDDYQLSGAQQPNYDAIEKDILEN